MPMETKDLDGGVGVLISASGLVTETEYLDALTKHLTQDEEKFKKYRYTLCDYTAITDVEVSADAIRRVAELSKTAAVINDPVLP